MQQWPVVFITEDQQVQVQLKKKLSSIAVKRWLWSTKNLCVFGNGLFTGSSWLFLCNLHIQGSPSVVLVPDWQKLERYVKDVLAGQMRNSVFFVTPRTKDVGRRPCPTNTVTHTYFLFSFSHFLDVSRHRYPFVILIPLFFCVFFLPLDTNRLRGESSFRP